LRIVVLIFRHLIVCDRSRIQHVDKISRFLYYYHVITDEELRSDRQCGGAIVGNRGSLSV